MQSSRTASSTTTTMTTTLVRLGFFRIFLACICVCVFTREKRETHRRESKVRDDSLLVPHSHTRENTRHTLECGAVWNRGWKFKKVRFLSPSSSGIRVSRYRARALV